MKYNQKALFEEMLSFYLITSQDDGEDLYRIRALMGALVRKARKAIDEDDDVKSKIHKLLKLVYEDWGFHCDPDHYFDSSNLYLNRVLETHSGMPVSLGAIILYLAQSLALPLYPVNFPNQLILRAEIGEKVIFIDPWNGQYLTRHQLQQLYEGAVGFGSKLKGNQLEPADITELLNRFNQLAKNALIREAHNDSALKYIESLIRRHPQDPYEIRDRGLVLAQMGCYHAAVEDLIYFLEQCPQDPSGFLILGQLSELKQNAYSIH